MRLIRKLALQKQKHTKKKKKKRSCSGLQGGLELLCPQPRFGFPDTRSGQERAQLLPSGFQSRTGRWCGEPPCEYSARFGSGPSTPARGCRCAARTDRGLVCSALWFPSLPLSLPPCQQKVDDSALAGLHRDGGGGALSSERSI